MSARREGAVVGKAACLASEELRQHFEAPELVYPRQVADVRADAMLTSLLSDEEERARFYPWAIWDLRHDARGSIGAHYLAETKALDDTSRRLLRGYLRSACRFYELDDTREGSFAVREYVSGRRYEVVDDAMLTSFRNGTVVFGRILTSSAWHQSRFDAIYHVLPSPLFARFLKRAKSLPDTPLGWTRAYPRLMEQLDEVQSEGLETTTAEGDRVLISTLIFDVAEGPELRAHLKASEDVLLDADLQGGNQNGRGSNDTGDGILHDDEGRALAALDFVPGSSRLRCICESAERAELARERLLASLTGHGARFLTTIYSNVDFVVMEALERLQVPKGITLLPGLRDAFAFALSEFLDDWWDLPLTRFHGQSPRSVFETEGRQKDELQSFLARLEPLLKAGPLTPQPHSPTDRRF